MDVGRYVKIIANAIAGNRISCAIQDIQSVSASGETLYGECLARLIETDGRIYPASTFILSLEALHEAPMLDRHILKLVLDLLDANPMSVLGCNLSADNFAGAATWDAILSQIQHRSHLAPRLVLELTESQQLSDLSSFADKIAAARHLGCRIALDDFGAGFASPRLLQLFDFDIIKIDRAFISDIRLSAEGRSSLQNIVDLASCFAPLIVVEGVETATQIDAARAAGATHFQGHFFAVPTASGVTVSRNAEAS